ncbi:MAG TPA: hypothetical protein VMT47_16060 [Polyangia bacterium]|nr:hypothetical protein [Polyangia bacterium]
MAICVVAACSSPGGSGRGGAGSGDAAGGGGQAAGSGTGGGGGVVGGPGGASAAVAGQGGVPPDTDADAGGTEDVHGSGGMTGVDAADVGPDTAGGCEAMLSDDFGAATLGPCWKILNGSPAMPLISVAPSNGALHLRANGNQNGVWYQTSTKALVYKEITAANFKVTTTAHPRMATAPTMLPTKDLHVGGVMVRNPSSAGGTTENYLFLMVGHSEQNAGTVHEGVEFKTTVNGCSDFNEPDWGASAAGPDAELRICRIGAAFRLYKRVPGDATWTLATPPAASCAGNVVAGTVLTRADLPERLQVGLALNFSAPSDLDVGFDQFTFVPLGAGATAADCTSD